MRRGQPESGKVRDGTRPKTVLTEADTQLDTQHSCSDATLSRRSRLLLRDSSRPESAAVGASHVSERGGL